MPRQQMLEGKLQMRIQMRLTTLAVLASICAGGEAVAQSADIATHKKSVSAALGDLGVGEFEALRCMAEMPDHVWLGTKLNKAQGAKDKAAMLSCLQKEKPDLTEAQLDQAVNLFR